MKEKVRIGPLANTGAYWFASTKEFMKVADSIIQTSDFQLGEAYISCVLKAYLSQRLSVKAVQIIQAEYSNVGTPACLETYLQQQGKGFLFDLDGTLADTTDTYVKAWHKLLCSKGAFVDEEFFIDNISGLSDAHVCDGQVRVFLSARLRKMQSFLGTSHLLKTYKMQHIL